MMHKHSTTTTTRTNGDAERSESEPSSSGGRSSSIPYQIDRILQSRRVSSHNYQYLVSWTGWGRHHDQWIDQKDLPQKKVEEFRAYQNKVRKAYCMIKQHQEDLRNHNLVETRTKWEKFLEKSVISKTVLKIKTKSQARQCTSSILRNILNKGRVIKRRKEKTVCAKSKIQKLSPGGRGGDMDQERERTEVEKVASSDSSGLPLVVTRSTELETELPQEEEMNPDISFSVRFSEVSQNQNQESMVFAFASNLDAPPPPETETEVIPTGGRANSVTERVPVGEEAAAVIDLVLSPTPDETVQLEDLIDRIQREKIILPPSTPVPVNTSETANAMQVPGEIVQSAAEREFSSSDGAKAEDPKVSPEAEPEVSELDPPAEVQNTPALSRAGSASVGVDSGVSGDQSSSSSSPPFPCTRVYTKDRTTVRIIPTSITEKEILEGVQLDSISIHGVMRSVDDGFIVACSFVDEPDEVKLVRLADAERFFKQQLHDFYNKLL